MKKHMLTFFDRLIERGHKRDQLIPLYEQAVDNLITLSPTCKNARMRRLLRRNWLPSLMANPASSSMSPIIRTTCLRRTSRSCSETASLLHLIDHSFRNLRIWMVKRSK